MIGNYNYNYNYNYNLVRMMMAELKKRKKIYYTSFNILAGISVSAH